MKNIPSMSEIDRLRAAAFADLDATSDEELLQELKEDGVDAAKLDSEMKASMQASVSAALRTRLAVAKSAAQSLRGQRDTPRSRPPLERLKQIVLDALSSNAELRMAFRNGTKQTDADFISLYDDMIETDVIQRDDDAV